MEKSPEIIAYKIARNLGYGFVFIGIYDVCSGLLMNPYSPLVAFLALFSFFFIFLGLIILLALKKLGEITENFKILRGIRFLGYSLFVIFFVIPPIVSIGGFIYGSYFISSLALFLSIILLLAVSLLSVYYLFMGLKYYGESEGSSVIATGSKLLLFLIILNPAVFFLSIPYYGFETPQPNPLWPIEVALMVIQGVILIVMGKEFLDISYQVKSILEKGELDRIIEEARKYDLRELATISREKNIPFILLASLREGLLLKSGSSA